jgi:N-acetylneuraminate synthase
MINTDIYIIAEAGVNHNGSAEMAFKLIDAALEAGTDAVKFQSFKAENLVTKSADKAAYQNETTDSAETQFEMLKKLELSYELHHELIDYCKKEKIEFLSSAFDLESLYFLSDTLKLKTLKIPSGEITNGPLLLAYAKTGCELILSTGMSTLGEIEDALGVLAFGLISDNSIEPSKTAFQQAYLSIEGQKILKDKITLLHCTTEYPAPSNEINLNAMQTMRTAFGLQTGYSDHSEGITVPVAATAMGATVIEKHFTLDRMLPGPDHKASLEPDELKAMVKAIRTVEQSMGGGFKGPMPSELKNRPIARKSLVAAKDIKQGEKFSEENITFKRPGTGISPIEYWDMIGKTAQADTIKDALINQ